MEIGEEAKNHMETIKKRLLAIETQNQPKKPTLDLIKVVADIRMEQDRLMALSPEAYEAEMAQPPHSKINQTARAGVAYQKHFLTLSPEDKKSALGYAGFSEADYIKALETRERILSNPDNWIARMFAERAKNAIVPKNPKL